ncbi:hypothetical protein [Burkholderia aenigmatica]|uniref:hypothetical protein n=1 Tax=Burkholderia aenigmatica TaxID=2015348 RepID=UPI00264BA046|nr:hypothetical protein [Burkholderia aenigmatica]MDN7880129.1 hypothetical protein [Burkholderia aenigmatica]
MKNENASTIATEMDASKEVGNARKAPGWHTVPAAHKHDPVRYLNRRSRGQAGATTGDYILWSILAAGVLIVSLIIYIKGSNSGNAQGLIKDFNVMASDAGQTYNGNWANFTTANAQQAGIFKGYSSWTDTAGAPQPLTAGGTLAVAPGTLQVANDAGAYTLAGVAFQVCKDFTSAVQKTAGSLTVNGATVKAYGGTFQANLMQCKDTANTVVVTRGL